MTTAANVSSCAPAIACTNFSLQRLLVKKISLFKYFFVSMWIVKPFLVGPNDFCTLPLNIRITFTNSTVKTNYSRIKVDAYCFECVLALVSVNT